MKNLIFKSFDNLNWFLGVKLFKNANFFSINLFNHFYKKNICNHKLLEENLINDYHHKGYAKLNRIDEKLISDINTELKSQNLKKKQTNQINFKITPKIFEIVKKIINKDLGESLRHLENYYNQKLILAHLTISRNYETPKNYNDENYYVSKKVEPYSNFYHTDGYVFNMFKIFINLQDVSENEGPLHLVKKDKADKFIKLKKFYSREKYLRSEESDKKVEDCVFKNTGKLGDTLICNTAELIHKAGDVSLNEKRDILFMSFVASPDVQKSKDFFYYNEQVFEDKIVKRLSKIPGIRNLILFYQRCKKFSLNS